MLAAHSGCTVVSVGASAVSVTATTVGLAADAAVGTAKIVGKGVGKAYDAMTEDAQDDNSGIAIKYRESDPRHPALAQHPGASSTRPAESAAPSPAAELPAKEPPL
ncbi:MAG TPA: hypothetical protein PLL92_05030 [Alicycliphilus sp.]|nr:hypothetical protein [Alicycliphilus sp.]